MNCFIKDRKTFGTLLQRPVSSWSLCVDSVSAERSTLTLPCEDISPTLARSWCVFDGKIYLIDQIQTDNGTTRLTMLPFWALFDRDFVFVASASYMGAFIRSWINAGWIAQSDTEYAATYISATSTDTTPYVAPEKSDNGVFSLLDYILLARQKGVDLKATLSSNLAVTISTHTPTEHVLVDKDGHTRVISSTFSGSSVAKITVVQPVDSGNVDAEGDPIYTVTQTVWYLAKDGSISTTVPAQRAEGEWVTIEIGEDETQSDAVQAVVDENYQSYKVDFWSDIDMAVGDTYKMRLNGTVFEGTISAKYKDSSDERIRYSSGALPTTLTERLARLGGK